MSRSPHCRLTSFIASLGLGCVSSSFAQQVAAAPTAHWSALAWLALLAGAVLAVLGVACGWLYASRHGARREAVVASQFASQFASQVAQMSTASQPASLARGADEPPPQSLWLEIAEAAAWPLLLLARESNTARWRVLHCNAAMTQALGLAGSVPAFAELQAKLPNALREALTRGEPPREATPPWLLRLHVTPQGQHALVARASTGPSPTDESAGFTYALAHDLRAPVRVTEGFARILKEDYGRQLDRIGNDHLDRVLAAGARMNQMIDALLSMAKLSSQPLSRHPVNLSQMAQWVLDECRRQNPERVVQVQIEPGLQALGDPTLLRQLLENLLGNAWKYSAKVENAQISFSRVELDGRPAFVVRDNGAGFDMRSAERLFGLFQRLHSPNEFVGTGVGLASVQRIVRRHGGEVWAESEPGAGANFYFTLAS